MLMLKGVLAFGFGSGLIFLVRTPQGDTFVCFTYLSGIKKIITLKRKPLSRTLFIQTSPLWKVNNSGFNTALTLISSDQFYQFCSETGIASDVLFIST